MTRKDYVAIANIIQDSFSQEDFSNGKISLLIENLADYMESDNQGFDRDRFKIACDKVSNL